MMKFYGTMVCKDCLEAREHLNAAVCCLTMWTFL